MARIKLTYKPGKIIIISDVHANWDALFALQQTVPNPVAVFCLGDIVGYGPEPKHCVDVLRAGATHLISGRHDRAVSFEPDDNNHGFGDFVDAGWRHTRLVLSDNDCRFLASLPREKTITLNGRQVHLTRLSPDDEDTETSQIVAFSQARLKQRFSHIDADVILLGGAHIPALRQIDDKLIVCPGSLGFPCYGVPEPTFAVWQPATGQVKIHHLHYDVNRPVRKISLLPLSPEHRHRLQTTLQTGLPI
jgi:predicted phosphodiesterase